MTDVLVRYQTFLALQRDCGAQFARNGLYLQKDLALAQFAPVSVTVQAPDGASFALPGELVAVMPGQGCAVQFKAAARPELDRLFAHAAKVPAEIFAPPGPDPSVDVVVPTADELRAALDDDDLQEALQDTGQLDGEDLDAARADVDDEEDEPAAPLHPDQQSMQQQLDAMTVTQKRNAAMHGGKEQRLLLIKDKNKGVHAYVVRNPAISLDEIEQISKMTSVSPEVLHIIGRNPDWTRSQSVLRNLVRNPKLPVPDAVLLVDKLPESEIRYLVKSPNVRNPLKVAARKKLHGNE